MKNEYSAPRPYLFIANWKMYFSYHAASAWITTYHEEILNLIDNKNISFIVCPSYDALASVASSIKHPLYLGAQDCSSFIEGAYTGQVSAQSLYELGCAYSLVGHSETRLCEHLQVDDIILKIKQLLRYKIIPIVCIGETEKEYHAQKSIEIVCNQLEPLLPLFQEKHNAIHIAYEPIWAIGTNNVPSQEHLERVFNAITQFCNNLSIFSPILIYGGSIDEKSVQGIIKIPQIRGILVGRVSTDFKKIKTIVSLLIKRPLRT